MPVGPSHGSRSSGGSSRGGSFGGGSFGGGSSGGGFFGGISFGSSSGSSRRRDDYRREHHYHRHPRSFHFGGRTVVVSTGQQSVFSVLIMFMIFAIVGCFLFNSFRVNAKDNVRINQEYVAQFESDDTWYRNTIDTAKLGLDDEYYIATATFRNNPNSSVIYNDYFFNEANPQIGVYSKRLSGTATPYYYIVYEYFNKVTNQYEKGWTYTQFSQSQIPAGTTIEIAYAKDGDNFFSMNTSYKLELNQDYQEAKYQLSSSKESLKKTTSMFVVCIIVVVLFATALVLVVVRLIKKAKKEDAVEDAKNEAAIAEAEAKADEAERVAKQKGRVCKYCGNSVPDGASACPACGSRNFE